MGMLDASALVLAPLQESDLEEVCAIERDSFSTPWARTLFEEELRRPGLCFWLALVQRAAPLGEKLAAYGGFWKAVDEAHFTNVAVRRDWRRRGVGRRLVRALLQRASPPGSHLG